MKTQSYNENKPRGRFLFPAEYHYVTCHHPRYNMPYHWHIEYEIVHVLQGEFHINVDDSSYILKQGDILFINDGSIHGGRTIDSNTIYECIVFDKKLFTESLDDKKIMNDFLYHKIIIKPLYRKDNSKLYDIAKMLFESLRYEEVGYEYLFQGGLLIFLGLIFQQVHCIIKLNTTIK